MNKKTVHTTGEKDSPAKKKADSVIEFNGVTFSYNHEPVLEHITFNVLDGDFVGVIGPNGGGKTTILKLLLGLVTPPTGTVSIYGMQPARARKKVGYMPQYTTLDRDFPITVREVVAMGLFNNTSFFPVIGKKKMEMIHEAMQAVKVDHLAGRQFGDLSGGQKQRCLIARAVVARPQVLLLDEPTASVDTSVEKDIYELLKELNSNMTIMLVSHDLGFISKYINRVFCVNRFMACHSVDQMNISDIIKETYDGSFSMMHHHCSL
jgi:zinc transport system ATP-binding protein